MFQIPFRSFKKYLDYEEKIQSVTEEDSLCRKYE